MAYVITRLCIRAGDCVAICPVACIVSGPPGDASWPLFYIDPASCIDCGACVPECQANAIFPESEVPAEYAADTAANRQFFASGSGYWPFDLKQEFPPDLQGCQRLRIRDDTSVAAVLASLPDIHS